MNKSKFNRFLVLLVGLLTMCVTQVWATDYTLTFEGTGTFPYNPDWTVECTENTSENHTSSGSKCGSFNFSTVKYITYKNALTNVKSISFWTNRTTNNNTNPTFTLEGTTDNGSSWNALGSSVIPSISKNTWGQSTITLSTPFTGKVRLKYSCTSTAVKLIDDITITTQAATICTVTFNAGTNGTCSTEQQTEESAGAGVTLPNVTANTGYRFVGWSTSSTPTSADAGKAGDTYKPSANCTLYAYYIQTHAVNWYVNGSATPVTVDHGADLAIPDGIDTDIECNGKVFVGWCTTASYSNATTEPTGMFTSASGKVNADVNYYAVFATKEGGDGVTKITDYNNIVDGKTYYIGGTASSTDYYLVANSTEGAGKRGSTTSLSNAGIFTFTGSNTSWKIKVVGTHYYMILNSTNASVTYTTSTTEATYTAANNSSLIKLTNNSRMLALNAGSTSNFGSYGTTFANGIWLIEATSYSNYTTTCGPATYTASIVAHEKGSIKLNSGTDDVTDEAGTEIALSATPNKGYKFSAWVVKNSNGDDVTSSVTISDNKLTLPAYDVTVSATFEAKKYEVMLDKNEHGEDDGMFSVIYAATIDVENDFIGIEASTGWELLGYYTATTGGDKVVTVEGTLVDNVADWTSADGKWIKDGEGITLYAQYEELPANEFTITLSQSEGGTIGVFGGVTRVEAGATVTLTTEAATGYSFTEWTVLDGNGDYVTVTDDNQFTMPSSNVEVEATFTKIGVTSIELDVTSKTVLENAEDFQLTATITPSNAFDKSIVWETNAEGVATVTDEGLVHIVGVGVANITATSYDNMDQFATCVVTVNAIPTHHALWIVNGHEYKDVEYKEGQTITLAADPTENIPDGYVFKGWYEGDYKNESVAPEYVTVPGNMGAADRTFNAVFAKETEVAGDTYNLVESALTDYSGDYLIVYNNTYAMNTHSGNQNTNTFATYTDVSEYYTEEKKSIASNTTTDALVYRAAKTTNGYSLYCVSDESYLGITANTTSTGAKLRWNTSYTESADDWTLGVGSVGNVGSNTMYIRWNNNSGSYRFAVYASNGQQAVQLFKKPVRTETSNYCTSYIKMYDVKYVVDGEEDTDLAQEVAENTTPAAVAEPTKVGYTFNGWYAVPECTGEKVVPTEVTITEDKTFYGKFAVNNYAITLDKNGAVADGSASVNYDATVVTTISHVAAWAGHELKGYYTATDNDEKVLNADGTFAGNVAGWIADGKWAKAEAATLYAQWNVLANCSLGADLVGCTADGENLAEVTVNTVNVVLNYVLDANRTWTGATVTVTMGMETLVANTHYTFSNGVLTFSTPIIGNVNVTISAPYASATLTLSAIGNEYTFGENLKVTDEITLPATANVLAAGKTFMGWSTVAIETEGAAPVANFYAKGAQYTIASTTDKLYAVYATETPGAVSWNKVTASAADWSGDYLLVYNDAVAWTGVDASSCGAAVTVSNNVISTKPDGAAILTIAEMTDGYSIQVNGGLYVGHEGAKNGMTFSENEILNTISYSDEISVVSGTNMNLRYNKSADQQRFRYYGSGQEAISLFKKTFGASTYSNYTTSGTLHVDAPTFNIETKPGTYTDINHQVRLNVPAGTTVYYTLNGDAPDNTSTEYVDGITLTGTATVKAVAYVGENASEVLEGLFTINHFTDFAAMQAAVEPNTNVGMTLTNAYVLGVYSLSKQLFVQMDGKGMVLTCTAIPDGIEVGKKLTGEIIGQFIMNLGRPQINSCVLDAGMVVEDGVRPAATLLTQVDETTVDANLLTLVKVNNVYSISKNSSDIVMNTQADGEGDVINVNNLLKAVENTLPEQELACNVIGIFNVKTENGVTTYSIIPVLKSDFAVVTPKLAELPTVDVVGSTDSENPMEVAVNKQLTITKPAAGYTGKYSFNGAAATTMTASSYNVTITNADAAESLTLTSTRPYYTDNSVTYYYKANSALNEYDINYPAVQSYVGISGAASALPGSEVVLTGTVKVEHYHLGDATVSKADDETTTVEVVREGNTYTFTMPEYAVNVKIGYTKDPTYSVTYQKGGKTATGVDPSETAKYEGDVVTLKPNTWKAAGYTFDHWKVVYTDAEEQEVEVTVTDDQFIMPAYAVKVIAQWNELLYSKPGAWELVTDASELAAGDYVIFAAASNGTWYAGSSKVKNTNKNLYTETNIAVSDGILTYTEEDGKDINDHIFEIQSGNEASTFAFYNEKVNMYLYAVGDASNNYLKTDASKASKNASWSVSINATNGEASVNAKCTSKTLLNINTNVFACYGSKQSGLKIFKFYQTARKVSFEANAGEDAVSNMPSMVRANATTNIATIPADVPTRKGYTFSSWNSAQNGQGVRSAQPGDNLELWQAECTLYAQWTLNKHAVTVADVEHGTVTAKPYGEAVIAEGANADVDYNKTVVITYTEDDDEYVFKAWKVYKTDDESEEIILNYGQTSTTFEMPDYPVTVSAVFESKASIEYTLTYDANGGTGEMEGNPFTKNWNTYITVSDNKNGEDDIFTKSNCTFNGWNTKADGTGTAYAAGAHFYIKSDVTLYAQWKGTGATYYLDKTAANNIKVLDGAAPIGATAACVNTYNGLIDQTTKDNTITITLGGYAGKVIKNISANVRANASGNGLLDITVGGKNVYSTTYPTLRVDNNSQYQYRSLADYGFTPFYVDKNEDIVIVVASNVDKSAYIQNITVEYADGYGRDLSGISTVCLPYAVAEGDYYGATFYEVAYLQRVDGTPYKIFFDEVTELEAGMPYLMVPNEDAVQAAFIYSGTKATEGLSHKGMIGKLNQTDDSYKTGDGTRYWLVTEAENEGNRYYMCYDNEIRLCGAWNAIYEYRAYFDVLPRDGGMPQDVVAPAPGRRRVSLGNPAAAPGNATGMENTDAEVENIQKVFINGYIYILRGEHIYDATGRLVK